MCTCSKHVGQVGLGFCCCVVAIRSWTPQVQGNTGVSHVCVLNMCGSDILCSSGVSVRSWTPKVQGNAGVSHVCVLYICGGGI